MFSVKNIILSMVSGLGHLSSNADSGSSKTKDTFDCANPACKSKAEMFFSALKNNSVKSDSNEDEVKTPSKNIAACPVDREELGRSTWNLIHTIAANFPEEPTYQDVMNANMFFSSLALVYPCKHCASDFQISLLDSPPE